MSPFNIVVFVKQVPDNTKLKPEQLTGNSLPKEGVDMIVNPFDEYALETALRLKEAAGPEAQVTVISLGAASAKEIVKKTIAAGADAAYLLSDPAFLSGDSTSVAYALSAALKQLVPDAKIAVFGSLSLDASDGQTGPKVAEILDWPSLTTCKNAELVGSEALNVWRETERGIEQYTMTLPGVICMMKCDYELRTANIKGVMKANKTEIPFKTPAELGLETSLVGAAAATSQSDNVWPRPAKTSGIKVDATTDAKAAVDKLVAYLRENKVL